MLHSLISGFNPKFILNDQKKVILTTGIHGVGKSTFIDNLKDKFPWLKSVKASDLLKWDDSKKTVNDISKNQEYLKLKIGKFINNLSIEDTLIIDGHITLEDINNIPTYVGDEIIHFINPQMIFHIERCIHSVQISLFNRDGLHYDINRLAKMMKFEKECIELYSYKYNCQAYNITII